MQYVPAHHSQFWENQIRNDPMETPQTRKSRERGGKNLDYQRTNTGRFASDPTFPADLVRTMYSSGPRRSMTNIPVNIVPDDEPPPLRRVMRPAVHASFLNSSFLEPNNGIKMLDSVFPTSAVPDDRRYRDTNEFEKIIGGTDRVRNTIFGILTVCTFEDVALFWKSWLVRHATEKFYVPKTRFVFVR
jgi:hypothetical protein